MTSRRDPTRRPVEGALAEPGLFERIAVRGEARQRRAELAAFGIAIALHLSGGANAATSLLDLEKFSDRVRAEVIAKLGASVEIEPEPEQLPEPEPEPEEEPEEEEVEPDVPLPPVESDDVPLDEAPSPAAAEAGQVLTSQPDPDEPLDLTADGFISGTGTRFSGGITASDGTSKKAVRNRAAKGSGVEGAKGKAERPSGPPPVDKSKPAGLPQNANWRSCPFPPEADAEQIHQSMVRVVVVVGANGRPTNVSVLSDPGYGFGRVARSCAMRFDYPPGLDKMGNPVATATRPFVIHFTR